MPSNDVMPTRRAFLSALSGALAAPLVAQAARRPNFLIIYTDDQGIGDVGCYGAKDVKTPHMDRLAARGVRFTDWYSNSPVCSPSRAALLTGKYPQRVGIPVVLNSSATFDTPGLRAGEVTLARELQKLSYRTAAIGKWHLGSVPHSRPRAQGFDDFFGFYSGWIDGFSHRYYVQTNPRVQQIYHDLWHNDTEVWEDPNYHTEVFARRAVEFLGSQTPGNPFFLYVAFGAPHYPMIAPRKYLERFPATMDRDRRMHAASVAAVDDGIGAILDALRARGLDRDTVIFFQSDNGATEETRADHRGRPYRGGSNAPFRGFKAGLFEGGIRMPASLSWPGRIPAGKTGSEVGLAMDIFPTFLRWADPQARVPDDLDGRDAGAMVASGAPSPHDDVFWSYQNQTAIRRGAWKLIVNPPSVPGDEVKDPVWLSNLKDDPYEKRNWLSEQTQVAQELRRRLDAWKATLPASPRPASAGSATAPVRSREKLPPFGRDRQSSPQKA
jgi:arylsulfatase A-like enzyme